MLDLAEEKKFWDEGFLVFGADEAGRGCLAGPVCAGVTAWMPHSNLAGMPRGVTDSKKISAEKRDEFFEQIQRQVLAGAVGFASAAEIDRFNILQATHLAVARAFEQTLEKIFQLSQEKKFEMKVRKIAVLSDGKDSLLGKTHYYLTHKDHEAEFPRLKKLFSAVKAKAVTFRESAYIKGDGKVYSIASASILAKVSRDRRMQELALKHPAYAFEVHKGYGTELHLKNLQAAGPCIEHRRTFAPVSQLSLPF